MGKRRLLLPVDEWDDMKSVQEMLQHSKELYGDQPAFRQFEAYGTESTITYTEFAERVNELRAALMQDGMQGLHFAVVGETSLEWISVYLAVIGGIGIAVPIDKELSDNSIIRQLNHADVDVVFVSRKSLEKIRRLLPQCPGIKTLVVMRGEQDVARDSTCPCAITTYSALLEKGKTALKQKRADALPKEIRPDAPCVIIFTSGTTGANKGVVLSNRNITGTIRGCLRLLRYPKIGYSVLPINHSYELHANILGSLCCGTCVCINDELRYLLKNLKHFKPEMSCMVPMMLDTIVRQLKKEIQKSGKQDAFDRACKMSNALRKTGIDRRRVFFKDILDSLGGNLKMIICGGSFLDQEVADFLTDIGIDIYNGYGITECAPVAAVNSLLLRKRGSAGHVVPTAEIRIMDPDEKGNGEIQIRGDLVMQGYYKDEGDTARVFTEDGWFRTGDLGHVDKDRYLFISGRLKNLIILPNGKNICPEEIEESLIRMIPYIKECVVTENVTQSGLLGHIYPDPDFCKANGLTSPEEIKIFMRADIECYNRSEPGYKRLSDYQIRLTEFEKNTTQKILRYKVIKQHGSAKENRKREKQNA